jgi:probable phosphoglycerate mutase
VLEAYQELHRSHGGRTVLVVGHNTLLRLTLCALLGIPLNDYRRRFPRLLNAAISEVRLATGGGALYTLNDSTHLRG